MSKYQIIMTDEREELLKALDRAATALDGQFHKEQTLAEKLVCMAARNAMFEARRQVRLHWFLLDDAGFNKKVKHEV